MHDFAVTRLFLTPRLLLNPGLLVTLVLLVCIALGAATTTASRVEAGTLDKVRARGTLVCGVGQELPGFSVTNDAGDRSGLDVDFCRAVAAAIFATPDKVTFRSLSAKEGFAALRSEKIDLLARSASWTMARDTAHGVHFAGVLFFDGHGFMVRKELGVTSALELSGASICTYKGASSEPNVADFFHKHKMPYEPVTFEKLGEVIEAYEAKRCGVYTTDLSYLAARRLKLAKPDEHIILPEIISMEPLGPVVRQGDDQWLNLVAWVRNALINAEELGVSGKTLNTMMKSTAPAVRRLLGLEGDFGKRIGLGREWAANIIRHVGNYGEIFARSLGTDTPIGLERGLNRLWTEGGLLYAPPIR